MFLLLLYCLSIYNYDIYDIYHTRYTYFIAYYVFLCNQYLAYNTDTYDAEAFKI